MFPAVAGFHCRSTGRIAWALTAIPIDPETVGSNGIGSRRRRFSFAVMVLTAAIGFDCWKGLLTKELLLSQYLDHCRRAAHVPNLPKGLKSEDLHTCT